MAGGTSSVKTLTWEQVAAGLNAGNTSIYLTIGKVDGWANDSAPPTANTSISAGYDVWRNMIGGKRILRTNIQYIVPKITWTTGTVYDTYDISIDNLFDGSKKFYVLTSGNNVYKCIFNNYGAQSTVEPTSVNTSNISQTADGYIWKFMYSLDAGDIATFTSLAFIPVKTLTADNGSAQWNVQNNATVGVINAVQVVGGGNNYSNASNLIITISGDGTQATATGTINNVSNTVNSISMTNYGYNYTTATISISGGGGSGATANALFSPPGGHGSNPLFEFGANQVVMITTLAGTEGGVLPAVNEFRQIAVIRNPLVYGTSNIASNTVFSQTTDIYVIGSGGDYVNDEIVFQGASVSAATFSGKIAQWDSSNNLIRLINTQGTPVAGALIGANTLTSRYVTNNINYPDLKAFSGNLIYINNISPITRNPAQTDTFNIVLGL